MELRIAVSGVGPAVTAMKQLAQQVDKLTGATQRLNQQASGLAQVTRRMDEFARATERLNRATAPTMRSLAGGAGANPGGGLDGAGGGLIAGLRALPGPLKIAAGAAVALGGAFKGLEKSAGSVAQRLSDFNSARLITGAETRDIAALKTLGIPVHEIPGASRGLTERLAEDPYAQMAGMSLGVGPTLPHPFGPTNEADVLRRALVGLSKEKNPAIRLQKARMLGLDEYVPLLDTANRHGQQLANDARRVAGVYDLKAQREGADFALQIRRLNSNLETLNTALGKFAMPFTVPKGGLADFVGDAGNLVGGGKKSLDGALDWWNKNVLKLPDPQQLANTLKVDAAKNISGAQTQQIQALQANTDALRGLTGVFRPGLYGGGPHARGAVPGALRQQMLSQALAGNALRAGAFSLF